MRMTLGGVIVVVSLCARVASADVMPIGGSWHTETAVLPYPVYGACAAYDPGTNAIYTVGGYSYQYGVQTQSMVQYYDLDTQTTGVLTGTLWSSVINYDTNSCAVIGSKIWYATYNQMCYFDLPTQTGSCLSAWYYPSYTYAPTIAVDGTDIYIASNYSSAWKFDTTAALQNLAPWTTLPNQIYARYDYPGAAFYDDHLYVLGGSSTTAAVERLDVNAVGDDYHWEELGAMPGRNYASGFIRVGQIVYALSGEQDYSYSNNSWIYDVTTGQSADAAVYMGVGRLYAGWVRVGNSIYSVGGYATTYGNTSLGSIERFVLPYDPAYDNDNDGVRDAFDDDDDDDDDPDWSDPCPMYADATDSDGDGLCLADDPCLADTDNDSDGDGLCLAADTCPFDADNDADADGVCGDVDVCPLDAEDDADSDGECADVDPCPADPEDDADADGVCGDIDICPHDETDDADSDDLCGLSDPCPLDAENDADLDGQCGNVDPCPHDRFDDEDHDGICAEVDDCRFDPINDIDEDGLCSPLDPCPLDPENDADGDGLCGNVDGCPDDLHNDLDGDGECADVDACPRDPYDDADGDGVCGDADRCPFLADDQADANGDGIGDACEESSDGGGCQVAGGGGGGGIASLVLIALVAIRFTRRRERPGSRR